MSEQPNIFLFVIGVALIIGSGIFWVIGGELDCSHVNKKQDCESFVKITNNGPIGIVLGFMMFPFALWIFPSKDKQQNSSEVVSE